MFQWQNLKVILVNNRLLIIGAGGHGRVVAETAEDMNYWKEIVFLDSSFPANKKAGVWKIIGKDNQLESFKKNNDEVIVGIGDNFIRMNLISTINKINFPLATIIHPSAYVSKSALIGKGTVIFPKAVVNYGARIGSGVIVNSSASIDHDNYIKDFVHISPGVNLGGNVTIGKSSWLGIGASVINGCNIGDDVIVGASSLVIDDVVNAVTVVGIPAMQIEAK